MAATANAFSLLLGNGEAQVAKAAKKKAKAKKPKAKQEETAGDSDDGAGPSISNQAAVAPPAPVANKVIPPAAPALVDVSEANAIFERASREAKTLADKVKLWRDWIRQANDKGGKGPKYKDSNGAPLEFKEVLLRGQALEVSVQSCLLLGLASDRDNTLAQLLSTFLPSEHADLAQPLAIACTRLSALLSQEAPDTVGAAQRAVFHTLAAMKVPGSKGISEGSGGSSAGGWLARVAALEQEIGRQQAQLNKLSQGSSNTVTKDQTSVAKQLLKLNEERFELLQPHNLPVAKAATGTATNVEKALADLKSVINNHLKEAGVSEVSTKGSASDQAQQRTQVLAACKREEAIIDTRSTELAGEIRTVEARLRSLKTEAAELEERRAQIVRQRAAAEQQGAGKAGRSQASGLSISHYRDELAAAEALHSLLDPSRSGGGSAQQLADVQAAQADAPLDYVAQGHTFLTLALRALGEMPTKISFCKQRLSQAEKLMALGAISKHAGGEAHAKQREDSERQLADTLRMAEDCMLTSNQVWNDVHLRYDALLRFNPAHSATVATRIRAIDALNDQIRASYDALMAMPEPAAPAPSAAAAASGRGGSSTRGGRPDAAHQQQPAAAAAAPAQVNHQPQQPPKQQQQLASGLLAALQPHAAAPVASRAPVANGNHSNPTPAPAAPPAAPTPEFSAGWSEAPVTNAAPAPAQPIAAPAEAAVEAAPSPPAATAPPPAAKPAAPPRTWGKVAPSAPSEVSSADDGLFPSLPTPGEAFKADDGFSLAGPSGSGKGKGSRTKRA